MLCLSWLILSLTLVMEQCHSRSNAHAPKSRMHKLDCKISRQKVLLGASGSDAGGAVIIGANVGNNKGNEDQWKFLSSKKMSHMWKVFVEPLPDHFSLLQTNIRKSKMANASAVHAAVLPHTFSLQTFSSSVSSGDTATGTTSASTSAAAAGGGGGGGPSSVDLFCHTPAALAAQSSEKTRHHPNASAPSHTVSISPKRTFCSLNPRHPSFTHLPTPSSSSSSSSLPTAGVWRVSVPAMSLLDLPLGQLQKDGAGEQSAHSGGPVRLLVLDIDDEANYQLLSELSSVNKLSALYRPSVITLNFGSFSQDQFDSSLDLLHQMQYMTCVATKRKGGQYLHAFHQPALLKLKGVQFI